MTDSKFAVDAADLRIVSRPQGPGAAQSSGWTRPRTPRAFHMPGKHNQKDHGRGNGSASGALGDRIERESGTSGRSGSRGAEIREQFGMIQAEKDALTEQRTLLQRESSAILARHEAEGIPIVELLPDLKAVSARQNMTYDAEMTLNNRARDLIKAQDPIGAPTIMIAGDIDTPTQQMLNGAEFVGSIVDRGAVSESFATDHVRTYAKAGIRANADSVWVRVRPDTNSATWVHEYAHNLEMRHEPMLNRSLDWKEARTRGDAEVKMSDVTGNPQYRDNEVTKPDTFINPYIGKNYGSDATEVMSMGLEYLYDDPMGFAAKDPDHFDFVMDQIQPSATATATESSYWFHLPGKHPQKRHGYRMKSGVKSVRDKAGDWKPVKYDKGQKTAFAGTKPVKGEPKPTGKRSPKQVREDVLAIGEKHGYNLGTEAEIAAVQSKIDALFTDPTLSLDDRLAALKPLQKERSDLMTGKGGSKRAATLEARDALRAENPIESIGITMTTWDGAAKNTKPTEDMVKGFAFVSSITDKSVIAIPGMTWNDKMPPIPVRTKAKVRAYQYKGKITIKPNESAGTVVHELGHALEHYNPAMVQRSIEWRDSRTVGEKAQKLSVLTGNPGYKPTEIAKPDKFFSPYIGKDYGKGASEVVSMGIEQLYRDPVGFAQTDPDMFEFIITQVQGA